MGPVGAARQQGLPNVKCKVHSWGRKENRPALGHWDARPLGLRCRMKVGREREGKQLARNFREDAQGREAHACGAHRDERYGQGRGKRRSVGTQKHTDWTGI